MSTSAIPPNLRDAIERHLTGRLGAPARVMSMKQRNVLSSSEERSFHLVEVEYGASGRAVFHAQLAAWRDGRNAPHGLDEYLAARPFPVPRFYGTVRDDGLLITLWEYCPGVTLRSFTQASPEHIEGAVRGMALISAQSHDAAEQAGVPARLYWAHPVADELRASGQTLRGLEPLLDRFAEVEDIILARLRDQEIHVLNHNDLVGRNTVFMEDGAVRIVDWDSASIGPAGASLRDFTKLDWADDIARLYASELRRHGVPARDQDVRFVMQAQQIFWNLRTGYQKKEFIRIRNGLNSFESLEIGHDRFRLVKDRPMNLPDTSSTPYPRPAPDSLKALVQQCVDEKGRNRLYSMIPHPDFAHIPAGRGAERFDMIAPHLSPEGGTALDLGAHFATFSHWLEDAGYRVTAVEHTPLYAQIAREVRDLSGKTFEIIEGSIFDLPAMRYDVVLALNIFHHFLKTKRRYDAFVALLERLHCDVMFFESHRESEEQMENAYVNMAPRAFAEFIAERTGLTEITVLGHDKKRTVFKLARPVTP